MNSNDLTVLTKKIGSLEDQNKKLITLNDGLMRTIDELRVTNAQLKHEIAQLNDELQWLENLQFRRRDLKGPSGDGTFLSSVISILKYLACVAVGMYIGIYTNQKYELGSVLTLDVVEYRFRQFEEYLRARRDD